MTPFTREVVRLREVYQVRAMAPSLGWGGGRGGIVVRRRVGSSSPGSCHHSDLRPVVWALCGQHSAPGVSFQLTLGRP